MKKLLLFILIFLILVIGLSQVDDKLSEPVAELLTRAENPEESKPYLYLAGIFANKNDKPENVGKKWHQEFEKQEADEKYKMKEYPTSKQLLLPDGALFCSIEEENCIDNLFESAIDVKKLQKEHRVLISRANKFYAFNDYNSLNASLTSISVQYQYLKAFERIKVLEAIAFHQKGKSKQAVSALFKQFARLRQVFEQQDNIIGKLRFAATLSELIDVSSIIISEADIDVDLINQFSQQELNFRLASAKIFANVFKKYQNFAKHPEAFSTVVVFPNWIKEVLSAQWDVNTPSFDLEVKVPNWISKIFYKPNLTSNAISKIHYRLDYLNGLTAGELAVEISHSTDGIERQALAYISKARNYVGDGAFINSYPNYEKHLVVLRDLQIKLAIFNHLYHYKKELSTFVNPYYTENKLDISEGKVCFKSPIENDLTSRCLKK